MLSPLNVTKRSSNIYSRLPSNLKFIQVSTIATSNVLFKKLLENSQNLNHKIVVEMHEMKSTVNDFDQGQNGNVQMETTRISNTTLLMDLMNEISGNFSRSLQKTTCGIWDFEKFMNACQSIDWNDQLNNNCLKTIETCCKTINALYRIGKLMKQRKFEPKICSHYCENYLMTLFNTLVGHSEILENPCVQLHCFEQLQIHGPKTRINTLIKTKMKKIDEFVDNYYSDDDNCNKRSIDNKLALEFEEQNRQFDTATKTKLLLLNLDLYLNFATFAKLPTWHNKFKCKYELRPYVKPNLLTYCIIFEIATYVERYGYSDTNLKQKKLYVNKLLEEWYNEFIDASTTLSSTNISLSGIDKLIYPIFKTQTSCNVDLEMAQILFDKLGEMNAVRRESFSYVFDCILRGNYDETGNDSNPFYKDLMKYVDMYINCFDKKVSDHSNIPKLLEICFKYNDLILFSKLVSHMELKLGYESQWLFTSIVGIIHNKEKQNASLNRLSNSSMVNKYYTIHDGMFQVLMEKCGNNYFQIGQLYHEYLSAIDRTLEYARIRDDDVICNNFYSWTGNRLLTLFKQRIDEITQQTQINYNPTLEKSESIDPENISLRVDALDSNFDHDQKLQLEMFVSNIIYLLLEVEFLLLKDQLIDSNGSCHGSRQSEDTFEIVKKLMNKDQNWNKAHIQCYDCKVLQPILSQEWKMKMSQKIMKWFSHHDPKLMDREYQISFINEMEKHGIGDYRLCNANIPVQTKNGQQSRLRFIDRL